MKGKNIMKSWRLWLIGVGLALVVGWVLVVCCKKESSYEELCREYYTKLSKKTSVDWKIEDVVKKKVDEYVTLDENERRKLYKEMKEKNRRLR